MRSGVRFALAAVLAGLFALTQVPAAAFENETFGVTPFPERTDGSDRSSFSIPLETGATFEDAVRIYNLTDETLRLAVYATDAQAALDDRITVGLRDEHPEGVGKWVDLALKSFELGPREAKTVSFRVKVRSSDPEPELGAIVVENVSRGLSSNSAQRLHVLVRTVPPNTQTSSKRVRTFLVQSPWIAIALAGLVLAGALVWLGARRARRPRDRVVEPGELETIEEPDEAPHTSRPVVRRLGAPGDEKTSVLDRVRASAGAGRRREERPLLDDALLVEVDEEGVRPVVDDDDADAEPIRLEPAHTRPAPASRSTRRSPARATRTASATKPAPRRTVGTRTTKPSGKPTAAKPKPARRSTAKARGRSAKAPARPKAKKATTKKTAKPKPRAKRKPTPADKNFIPLKDL